MGNRSPFDDRRRRAVVARDPEFSGHKHQWQAPGEHAKCAGKCLDFHSTAMDARADAERRRIRDRKAVHHSAGPGHHSWIHALYRRDRIPDALGNYSGGVPGEGRLLMIVALRTAPKLFALVSLGMLAGSTPSRAADAGDLPSYQPRGTVSGRLRGFGSNLGGVLKRWEEGFRKFHPGVRFEDKLPTSDAAIPALVTGVADLGPDG